MALLPPNSRSLLFGRLTLAVFSVIGTLVAFAEWGYIPQEGLLVGAPGIGAAVLLDTFLSNEFRIRTGGGIWLFIYVFLYVEAVVIATVLAWVRSHLENRDIDG